MQKPTIHLNGSGRENLANQLRFAAEELDRAMVALRRAAPHGRDYYPQGDEAINVAISEHEARLAKLQSVHADLAELYEHILFAGT